MATTKTTLQFIDSSVTFPPVKPVDREIRLLHIRRCSTKQSIVCELSVVSLNDSPKYNALSYVWGSKDDPETIVVNYLPFKITRCLHEILVNMIPWDNSAHPIWIDANCISQGGESNDLEERRHQVNMMGQVYANAASVIAYLGSPFPRLRLAMKCLELAANEPERHIILGYLPYPRAPARSEGGKGKLAEALFSFLSQPWWSRIWTVQEYIFGRTVIFQVGPLLYSADMVSDGFESLWRHDIGQRCCESTTFDGVKKTLMDSLVSPSQTAGVP